MGFQKGFMQILQFLADITSLVVLAYHSFFEDFSTLSSDNFHQLCKYRSFSLGTLSLKSNFLSFVILGNFPIFVGNFAVSTENCSLVDPANFPVFVQFFTNLTIFAWIEDLVRTLLTSSLPCKLRFLSCWYGFQHLQSRLCYMYLSV